MVREGRFFLSGKFLDSLRRFDVQTRKVGRPPYPNSLIILLALIRAYFKLPYRQTEGMAKDVLSKRGVTIPSYATIDRRVRELTMPMDLDQSNSSFELAIDSTGYKVSNRGDWMRERWKRKRG